MNVNAKDIVQALSAGVSTLPKLTELTDPVC